jgi:D-threo-aldose 1-dehydrogenase
MKASDVVKLGHTGLRVSRLGMGTGPLGAVHEDGEWENMVNGARQAGVRSFDTSPYYGFGNSERRLGRQLSKLKRDDFVLSTKVGRLLRPDAPVDPFAQAYYYPQGMPADVMRTVYDYSYEAAHQSVRESRERLGIERIDIIHIHDIIELSSGINHIDEALAGAFVALSELRSKGDISAVGVGAQDNQLLVDLAKRGDFDVFLIAGRYTLLDQGALDEVLPLCVEKDIGVIIGSPYNTGILHDPKPNSTFDFVQAPPELIEKALQIKAVCARYNVPLPAAAIQFPFAHPAVYQVLTGAVSPSELNENVRLMEVDIPAELWQELRDSKLINPAAPIPES